ncbi:MAG: CHAT domain-containing protein [Candidatus Polarisedimenticolia bacterium]
MRRVALISVCVLWVMAAGAGLRATPPGPALPASDSTLDRFLRHERYAEAMDYAVSQLRSRAERLGPMAMDTLVSLELVGQAASRSGELAIAETTLDAVLEAYQRVIGPDDPRRAPALITRGRTARITGERERSWRLTQEARRLLERAGPALEGVRADLEQAEGNWIRKNDMDGAIALYRSALARRRSGSPSLAEADTLTLIGWVLGRTGRFDGAERYLVGARDELLSLGLPRHELNGVIASALAEPLALQGRWAEAEPLYRQAATIYRASRDRHAPGFARRVLPLDGFDELAVIALRQGRGEEAWTTLQRSRAAIHLDFARLALWRTQDEGSFEQARALRDELLALRRALSQAARGGPSWLPGTWRLMVRSLEVRGLLRSLERRFLVSSAPPDASLERVRSMLGPDTALLGLLEVPLGVDPLDPALPLRTEGWLYVLRRTGPLIWVPLPPPEESDAARLRQAWRRMNRAAFWPLHVDPDPEVVADQRVWARRYFDPAVPYLRGVEHLVIEGGLLPYESLTGPDGRLVGDAYDVSYIPSALVASVLAERWSKEPERELRSVLAMSAAPPHREEEGPLRMTSVLDGPRDLRRSRRSFTRSETSLDTLPPLPYAGAEVSLVARKFTDAVVLHGPDSVERRLRDMASEKRLGRFDVIHFAGHSLGDGQPELAGLALAGHESPNGSEDDGILDVEEILLGWDLDARLLTLSGCETARAAGAARGEILGFTPALLATGARSVLASLWPVDDRAAAMLMDRFYDDITGRRGAPMPLARALREAKSHLRTLTDQTGRHPFEHPAYWAGFILIGLPEDPGGSPSR